ncbi:MAG: 4Fe-4S dicluster domain-containing protein, partial [Rhodobacteraceae bacterium]|nr:4Fe-4S dicluster domain-containing protein [Paracoccaceae bacterium]
ADPGDPRAVAASVFEAGQYIGTFEKPLYLRLEEHLCAHSRAGQTGCSNCLDICPTGAISPDGDHVAVDPLICAGCGACSALCPSGAITYDHPPTEDQFRRIHGLADMFRKAGGTEPRLLICDGKFGSEMISLAARFGAGLPADVIPLEVDTVAGFGHAEMLASLASGFVSVHVLLSPGTDRTALDRELALAQSLAGNCQFELLDINDPDQMSEHLYALPKPDVSVNPVLPLGSRRQVARLAAKALSEDCRCTLPLPETAPYGAVEVNTEACTLCLSCASLCPSGALGDNPDMPQLRFQEDACLQCGLCRTVCPENAITLRPQMNLSDAAFEQQVLHEEEPYACIECGALFGVKSTVEKIVGKLAGKHAMFEDSDAGRVIRMCDDCRVNAKFHSTDNPFEGGERPRTRMTDDYFSARKDH